MLSINKHLPLLFKANLALTSLLFVSFLLLGNSYSLASFTLVGLGAISSGVILYVFVYLLLFLLSFLGRFIVYIAAIIFVFIDICLVIDFFVFKLYSFHINGMVLNIITSIEALKTLQLGLKPFFVLIVIFLLLLLFEWFLIHKLTNYNNSQKQKLNKKINKIIWLPVLLLVLTEKFAYGFATLHNQSNILAKFKLIPLYQPLTFNVFFAENFGYKPIVNIENTIANNTDLNYPLQPIKLKPNPNPINIFIIANDSVSADVINKKTAPNITKFKQDALVFNQHYSGGNATRFGIFSLIYGLNSSYWFAFLSSLQGPVLFDVLKQLDYQIDIISSSDTDWPEFKKTCYVNIRESIKDDFKGSQWQKDLQSSNYFIKKLENYQQQRAIFSFIFLDSPHGRSFPDNHNPFLAKLTDNKNIDYLSLNKNSPELANIKNRYKNAVHYNDKLFGQMIAAIKKQGLYDNSLIIYTSDHGEEFYEYGSFGHNSSFSSAQTKVPMLIKLPKNLQKSIKLPNNYSNNLSSHTDIVPTILSLIGVKNKASDYSNGTNLLSKDFMRKFIYTANWNYNAIITPKYTYEFSNIINTMFSSTVRDNSNYKIINNAKIDQVKVLACINDNKLFLR